MPVQFLPAAMAQRTTPCRAQVTAAVVVVVLFASAQLGTSLYVPAKGSPTDAPPPAVTTLAGDTAGKCGHGHVASLAAGPAFPTEPPLPASTTEAATDSPTTVLADDAVLEVAASSVAPPPAAAALSAPSTTDSSTPTELTAEQREQAELEELFIRESARLSRYESGHDSALAQPRSLFSLSRRVEPPPMSPTPPAAMFDQEPQAAEISKDVYIHLAADEPTSTTRAPPPLPPRKHYKIIVIKPPTPPPPVETTTRGVEVETLIYVLVPKPAAPTAAPTTPRTPSKHEVFFIRYKAPSTLSTSTTTPAAPSDNINEIIDLRGAGAESRASYDEADENELDGAVGDSDAVNDLLSVSSDDIVRSWRRADGGLHFDADLKRIARSHAAHDAEAAQDDSTVAENVHRAVLDALVASKQAEDRPPPRPPCRDSDAEPSGHAPGRQVQGGPDFLAVLQRRSHYGRSVEVCPERPERPEQPDSQPQADAPDADPSDRR